MTPEHVIRKLLNILNKQVLFQETVTENDYDTSLTSQKIGLNYTHMIEFMMCIEESFEVIFTIEELRAGKFRTLRDISNLIYRKKCMS